MKRSLLVILLLSGVICSTYSQRPKRFNSAEIEQRLQKLNVLGNVLYVAAHPDDENTRLITYLANEEKLNTAYFSFTRGDGGQNLIGPEIREQLGLIRTQELLEARKIDNGQQYFSRAVDFGYSKHPDETFTIWDKEKVLGDLVRIIRQFRPDIIITRFNTTPGTTHGHHTASAILAAEAFDIAGSPDAYKDQLQYVDPWQPSTLYWNAYWWRRSEYMRDTSELLKYDIGKFNSLLGYSYSEIAALSRSSHRSQGFGATGSRGEQLDYLQYEKGKKAENDPFEVVDVSWGRVKGSAHIEKSIGDIIAKFEPGNPTGILADLLELRNNVSLIDDEFWKGKKLKEIDELIYGITGMFLEVKAPDYTARPGERIELEIEATNRSNTTIKLKDISSSWLVADSSFVADLHENKRVQFKTSFAIPEDAAYSQPYWLAREHSLGMFEVGDQLLVGKGENDPALEVEFVLEVNGQEIIFKRPVIHKRNDPVRGEVYRPFAIAPPVSVGIAGDVMIFANHAKQEVRVDVRAGKDDANGTVELKLPDSWSISPKSYDFNLAKKGEAASFIFTVAPPEEAETATARARVHMDGKQYAASYTEILYDHIPAQLLFDPAEKRFVKLDLDKGDEKIGYVMGAGDNIPENLRQIGFEVEIINDLDFDQPTLDEYDVIILGIRALNTVDRLKFEMSNLLGFAERGGTLIIQYNTSHRLVTSDFAPFPLELSRRRVAVEEAPVTILSKDHKVMNYPNKISDADFDHWVQERGLYFPANWSEEYEPILSSHDPGEDKLDGGLLVASYGKGHFVYSGFSWFRELPAGVPGAYRIFVNMISLGTDSQ